MAKSCHWLGLGGVWLGAISAWAVDAVPPIEPKPFSAIHRLGVSSNPGAINDLTGTGQWVERLGLKKDSGVFVGGVWVGDSNYLISGGAEPGTWSWNSLLVVSVGLDAERLVGWTGAKFGIDFLQFNGQNTNGEAGSAQGYNALPGPAPRDRSELYQLWVRQTFFDGRMSVRVGKMAASTDFNNVLRPVPTQDESRDIPAVSGLGYTPVFKNPTLIGVMPGYYNSAVGLVVSAAPTNDTYLSYGIYDGNQANGVQTGMVGPQFNGYYFNIGEAGAIWEIGADSLPGAFGVGLWHQSGWVQGRRGSEQNGMGGIYAFGSQRLWLQNPGVNHNGISGFFQLGANNSTVLPFNQYAGLGFTAFGLMPHRPSDSAGVGMSWAWLNPNDFNRSSELMFETYYQAHLFWGTYFQPALTYLPTPGIPQAGSGANLAAAWAVTMRVTVLF